MHFSACLLKRKTIIKMYVQKENGYSNMYINKYEV
jgi:hypothetical protein